MGDAEYNGARRPMPRLSSSPAHGTDHAVLGLLRVLAAIGGTIAVVALLLYAGYLGYTDLDPPPVDPPDLGTPEVEAVGRRISVAGARLERDGRLWTLDLQGSPTAMGAARGLLSARPFIDLHRRVLDQIAARYPSASEAWGASVLLRWRYRGADAALPDAMREELAAFAAALPEARTGQYGPYHVLFLYQVFPDLAKRVDDVFFEGFAFAVPGRAGAHERGNFLVGRTFDVDLGHDFEPERLVTFHHPDGKYPFASVGWPGLIGVVTGVNARGIFVALDNVRTDDPPEDGLPLSLLARQVLEEADTLDRAIEMLEAAKVRTAGAFLVADGAAGRAAVVELSARPNEERRVVRGDGDPVVFMTNHFASDVFSGDPFNDRIRRDTASGARWQRLETLLLGTRRITAERALAILRDRKGPDGSDAGLGNRNALETLHGSHAVVVDLSSMVLWVGEGPSAIGPFRAFDLRKHLGRPQRLPQTLADLPADPLLYSAAYADYQQALAELDFARRMLAEGRLVRARTAAAVGLALAPEVGELYRVMGEVERRLGHFAEARRHFEQYLELSPGRLRDHERVRSLLAELARE